MTEQWTTKITSCYLVFTDMDILTNEKGEVIVQSFGIGGNHRIDILAQPDSSPLREMCLRYAQARLTALEELEKLVEKAENLAKAKDKTCQG